MRQNAELYLHRLRQKTQSPTGSAQSSPANKKQMLLKKNVIVAKIKRTNMAGREFQFTPSKLSQDSAAFSS